MSWRDRSLRDTAIGQRMSLKAYNELTQLYENMKVLTKMRDRYNKLKKDKK
jgi:hypothetical protein